MKLSHFILKLFQPNSFGEVCFLEEIYKNMQKIQILKILKVHSIRHQGVCLSDDQNYWLLQHISTQQSAQIYGCSNVCDANLEA